MPDPHASEALALDAVERLLAGVPVELTDALSPFKEILQTLIEGLQKGGKELVRERFLLLRDLTPWLEDADRSEDEYPDYQHLTLLSEDDLHIIHKFIDTDFGEADALEFLYQDRLRFVVGTRWIIWTGMRWRRDSKRAIIQFGRMVSSIRMEAAALNLKEAVGEDARERALARARYAHSRSNLPMINRMLETAATMPHIVMEADQLDKDTFLLGVRNGVVNLKSGALIDARPDQYITRRTEVPYFPDAKCPTWERFILDVFQGDRELVNYIQRCLGYALTGDIREQYIWFCFGSGSNGKGTFMEIMKLVLGDYASAILFNSLMAGGENDKNDDIADLRGTRFIFASESEKGKKLNEARVKKMTGGDTQRARKLYGDFFQFTPEWKIWVMTNHKPKITGTDEGIWRRMRLIPFLASFKGKPDLTMPEKLRAELPGILSWCVRGCLDWQYHGLGSSKAVDNASDAYRESEDTLGIFMAEKTARDASLAVPASDLYNAYKEWARVSGIDNTLTMPNFKKTLEERGLEQVRSSRGNVWKGLGFSSDS